MKFTIIYVETIFICFIIQKFCWIKNDKQSMTFIYLISSSLKVLLKVGIRYYIKGMQGALGLR